MTAGSVSIFRLRIRRSPGRSGAAAVRERHSAVSIVSALERNGCSEGRPDRAAHDRDRKVSGEMAKVDVTLTVVK